MKLLITLSLMTMSLSVMAQPSYCFKQYYENIDHEPAYVPAIILGGTFLTVQSLGYSTSQDKRFTVAITGMVTACISYYVVREIKHKRYLKRRGYSY